MTGILSKLLKSLLQIDIGGGYRKLTDLYNVVKMDFQH